MKTWITTATLVIGLALVPFAAEARPADKVDVIVGYKVKPNQAEKNRVEKLGGKTKREFKNFNMRVISISENALKAQAEAHQAADAPRGANRAQALLVGNGVQEQVTREQRFRAARAAGSGSSASRWACTSSAKAGWTGSRRST